jgi:hypothetical protein
MRRSQEMPIVYMPLGATRTSARACWKTAPVKRLFKPFGERALLDAVANALGMS